MLVVVLMAGGALLALRSYNTMAANAPQALEAALFSIRQQAGVLAALSAAVFAVLTALQKGLAPASNFAAAASSVPTFGRPAGVISGSLQS